MRNEELFRILHHVQSIIEAGRYAFILPEHILWVLLDQPEFISLASYCRADLENIRKMIADLLELQEKVETPAEVIPTREYTNTVSNCAARAQLRSSEPKIEHMVLALLDNGPDSIAAYSLMINGITEEKVNRYLEAASFGNDPVGKYTVDLTEKARRGAFDPVIGREAELDRMIQILHKKRASNVILVSHPGVGKTALVEKLATRIAAGEVPEPLRAAELRSLDLGAMIAGARLRGEFEERLKAVIENVQKNPDVILFIDEIHCIVGAGGNSDGALDAGNILKPYLTDGNFRCIGATTHEEYKRHIQKDRALARRFRRIDLAEPSPQETLRILRGLRPAYEKFHGVKFSDEILEAIVTLAGHFLPEQFFPDKAVEVMDEIGSRYRSGLRQGREATPEEVEKLVCRMANIPALTPAAPEKEKLRHLAATIKEELFGQDEAVDHVVRHIKLARSGLTAGNKPLGVFGLLGSSGSGKTEFARLLAAKLGVAFLKLDMSEYSEKNSVSRLIGTSPGYIGFEQAGTLTEPLLRTPHCVVLLDEIEKADPAVHNLLLQVMDEGRLTDNNNREASFRNAILLMTGNVGCTEAERASMQIGFGGESRQESVIEESLRKAFAPEFRSRFTEIFRFHAPGPELLGLIVDKELRRLNENLSPHKLRAVLTPEARRFLVEQAFAAKQGGRPVERLIQRHVSEKLADAILFGELHDAEAVFTVKDGVLPFRLRRNRQAKTERSNGAPGGRLTSKGKE